MPPTLIREVGDWKVLKPDENEDEDGSVYYYNEKTEVVTWDVPADLQAALKEEPASEEPAMAVPLPRVEWMSVQPAASPTLRPHKRTPLLLRALVVLVLSSLASLLMSLQSRVPLSQAMSFADVFDLLVPLWLFPCFFLLFLSHSGASHLKLREWLVFLGCVVVFMEGHGMKLAATALSRNLVSLRAVLPVSAADQLGVVTHFYFGEFGPFCSNSGLMVLWIVILYRSLFSRLARKAVLSSVFSTRLAVAPELAEESLPTNLQVRPLSIGYRRLVPLLGMVYGVCMAATLIEGKFGGPGLAWSLVLQGEIALILFRNRPPHVPVFAAVSRVLRTELVGLFVFSFSVFSLLLLFIWLCWHGGFPEFSKLGWFGLGCDAYGINCDV